MFETVDRVVEAGHDPRRFAADLLQRLRDLTLVQAVPDAAQRGLVDVAADEVERMVEQAARLGPATLVRYGEIVHAGLTEMRGTTAPRLLLELLCARMLLPAATTSEPALLERLERMERRAAIAAAPVPHGATAAAPPPGPDATESAAARRTFVRARRPASDQDGQPAAAARPIPRPAPEPPRPTVPRPCRARRPPDDAHGATGGTARRGGAEGRRDAAARGRRRCGPVEVGCREVLERGAGGPEPAPSLEAEPRTGPRRPAEAARTHPDDDAARAASDDRRVPAAPPAGPRSFPPAERSSATGAPARAAAADRADPQQAAEPPQRPDALDAAAVRRVWSEILAAAKQRSRSTGALMVNATVRNVDGDVLVLAIGSEPLARRLSEQRNTDVIADALHAVLGVRWRVRCDHGDATPPPARPAAPRTAPPPQRPARPAPARPAPARRSAPDDGEPLPPEPPDEDAPPDDEEAMMAEAAADAAAPAARRDPEEVAIELLSAQLGATAIERR